MNSIIDTLRATQEEFIRMRHHFHQHPEIGFEEHQTSQQIADYLQPLGYHVTRGVGGTGVVATLSQGSSRNTLGLRADMDALPIQEKNSTPWISQVAGKFHGCGHDGHSTMLLCAARYLAETRRFNGTLHLIFQPAEELLYGAKVMLEDGLLQRFPCDAVFAMHNMPGIKAGEFCFREGPLMASSDTIHIEISGKGAHGAMPEQGIDATLIACQIACALQTIVARNIPPKEAAVITVGCIQSGEAPNVVNDYALMKLTVRALDNNVRSKLLARIRAIAESQASGFGAEVSITHVNGCPILVNPAKETAFAVQVAQALVGEDKLHTAVPAVMGSEDFAFMLEANPHGCYLMLGNGDQPGYCHVHNPGYDFNDQIIVTGAAYWAALTEAWLSE